MVKCINCLVWILGKKVGQLYEIVGQVRVKSRGYGRKWRWNPWRGWEWNNEGGRPRLILRSFRHMWMKNCLNHWKQISKHIFQFLFFPFFWILDKPFITSIWFAWIKLFERYRQSILDLCGLYYACIVVKAMGMKANVDSKNSKRCDGILEQWSLNNDAS